MKVEIDAKKKGLNNFIVGLVVLVSTVFVQMYFFNKQDFPLLLIGFFWFFALFVGGVFTWSGISMMKSGGKWEIAIDENGINWTSPDETIDQSFNFTLSELSKTETRVRSRKGKTSSSKRKVFLITSNGNEQEIKTTCGLNPTLVVTELERFGVKNKLVYT